MEAQQCIVDGQQRLNAIKDFIEDKLDVQGKKFSDLSPKEKEVFLKYEVPVIDFDLEASDSRLKEIFRRLNRTYYSLSAIERLASEFSASEFLLVARALCGELDTTSDEEYELDQFSDDDSGETDQGGHFMRDPAIPDESWEWLMANNAGRYKELLQSSNIFSKFEFDRKVPLMFTLNVMCTYIHRSYYNRNSQVRKFLDLYVSEYREKQATVDAINASANFIFTLDLPEDCIWWSKANLFTLLAEFSLDDRYLGLPITTVKEKLIGFSAKPPSDYVLAAREGTGRKGQRETRASCLKHLLLE
jgi:hypothetical protein